MLSAVRLCWLFYPSTDGQMSRFHSPEYRYIRSLVRAEAGLVGGAGIEPAAVQPGFVQPAFPQSIPPVMREFIPSLTGPFLTVCEVVWKDESNSPLAGGAGIEPAAGGFGSPPAHQRRPQRPGAKADARSSRPPASGDQVRHGGLRLCRGAAAHSPRAARGSVG